MPPGSRRLWIYARISTPAAPGLLARRGLYLIEGVDRLSGCRHRVIPDRIEAATYMAAAAVTGGSLFLKQVEPAHLAGILPAFEEAGCHISLWEKDILISAPARLRRIKSVRTMPYPGFPTDAQAPVMAMACVADGTSVFIENIFESRYKHAGEMLRLGARIKVEGRVAVVEGTPVLSGAQVECTASAGRSRPCSVRIGSRRDNDCYRAASSGPRL